MKKSNKDACFEDLDDCTTEVQDQFRKNIDAFEQAKVCQPFQILVESGISLPPPENLSDEELTVKLWEVIHALALTGIYLGFTDHLSDRELYILLWGDILLEKTVIQSAAFNMNCHIDLTGSGSKEDNHLYLKYYADEEDRVQWAKDFPDEVLPDHELLPFDRDRQLPKPSMEKIRIKRSQYLI